MYVWVTWLLIVGDCSRSESKQIWREGFSLVRVADDGEKRMEVEGGKAGVREEEDDGGYG